MDNQAASLTRETALERARKMIEATLAEADTSASSPAPATPWHEHGAFDDIDGARWRIDLARDALAGIGSMLQPYGKAGDEQLNMANRGDAAAVFMFFAEAMREPLDLIDQAAFRLKTALRTGQP